LAVNLKTVTTLPARLLDDLLGEREKIGRHAVAETDWRVDAFDAYCHRCGASMAAEAVTATGCAFCRDRSLPWQRVVRLGGYREPLRSWIIRMKFGGMWGWAEWFGEQLAESLGTIDLPAKTVIVPVPLHWMRTLRRGFDQARVMAESCAGVSGLPVARVLRRHRRTKPQSRITAQQKRWENVRDAFACQWVELAGWHVVLIDDVTTTGATARACAGLLKRAGAERITLAVASVVDPRGGDFHRF